MEFLSAAESLKDVAKEVHLHPSLKVPLLEQPICCKTRRVREKDLGCQLPICVPDMPPLKKIYLAQFTGGALKAAGVRCGMACVRDS